MTFLPHRFEHVLIGHDDEEVETRDAEMDSGEVAPISHDEFFAQGGCRAR